jgi:hypothetical protein
VLTSTPATTLLHARFYVPTAMLFPDLRNKNSDQALCSRYGFFSIPLVRSCSLKAAN